MCFLSVLVFLCSVVFLNFQTNKHIDGCPRGLGSLLRNGSRLCNAVGLDLSASSLFYCFFVFVASFLCLYRYERELGSEFDLGVGLPRRQRHHRTRENLRLALSLRLGLALAAGARPPGCGRLASAGRGGAARGGRRGAARARASREELLHGGHRAARRSVVLVQLGSSGDPASMSGSQQLL